LPRTAQFQRALPESQDYPANRAGAEARAGWSGSEGEDDDGEIYDVGDVGDVDDA
jgi:hypothetical protein